MGLGRLAARGLTMTDARRITVGPIAAAYLEIQQGVVLVLATDFDALHAEAEAMRVVLHEIASVNPAQRGIEWAKSYASDGLKGAGSELYARWLDTFKEAEALRAENGHWKGMHASSMALRMSAEFERDELRTELEEARGLLEQRIPCDVMLPPATTIKRGCPLSTVLASMKLRENVPPNQRVFTATPAPEVKPE